jgi:hypothetical protein
MKSPPGPADVARITQTPPPGAPQPQTIEALHHANQEQHHAPAATTRPAPAAPPPRPPRR